jgi:signal peptidase I
MPPATPVDTGLYCLTVGNGLKWRLHPVGDEAMDVVRRLASVMTLSRCSQGQEILVRVQEGARQLPILPGDSAPGICILPPGENDAMKTIQMTSCATTLAFNLLPFGGLLIHGALVSKDGYGIILAGPGTVGKSTACRRIPLPWHALSDDATLVIDDGHGQYLAYPWPTWSRFFDNGHGGTWDVGKSVPLKALFFLHQSPEDGTEPVNMTQSTAWVVESTHQVMGAQIHSLQELSDAKEIYALELRAAEHLVRSIPVHLLHISLTGKFWEEIERALPGMTSGLLRESQVLPEHKEVHHSNPVSARIFGPGHIPILYSGPSMNPVLYEQDLLDVLPYGTRNTLVGDVICFSTPEKLVVHRVIGIDRDGIRTQGDNNPTPDPDLQYPENILGMVVAASRGSMNRNIPGGNYGRIIRAYVRIRKRVILMSGLLLKVVQPALSVSRIVINRAVPGMNPRVILFATRNLRILRVYIGTHLAGEYDTRKKCWSMLFPFQCVVDKNHLPTVDPPSRPDFLPPQTETIRSAR